MPDTHSPYTLGSFARDVMQLLTMMFVFYTANIGSRNQEKIEKVEQRQEVVKDTLDKRSDGEAKAIEVNLYGNWKWLEKLAEETGTPKDKLKAAEAKIVYDEYVRHSKEK